MREAQVEFVDDFEPVAGEGVSFVTKAEGME